MAHGKVSRKKNRDSNLAKKKARREANQAHWQKLAEQGKNKKSKRFTLSGRRKRKSITKHMHPNGFGCGNLACYNCYAPLDKNGKRIPKGPAFEFSKAEKAKLQAFKGVVVLRGKPIVRHLSHALRMKMVGNEAALARAY